MKLSEYIKSRLWQYLLKFLVSLLCLALLRVFKMPSTLLVMIVIMMGTSFFVVELVEFHQKKSYYQELFQQLNQLEEQALLVHSILPQPKFYEGQLVDEELRLVYQAFMTQLRASQKQTEDFKEFIELWIHEAKIPLATLQLSLYNQHHLPAEIKQALQQLEDYLEQVLYFTRAENAQKDYLIRQVPLQQIIRQVAIRNQARLLNGNIQFIAPSTDVIVTTDQKWLGYILNQIMDNAIKYVQTIENATIEITVEEQAKEILLHIRDNGCGISARDLPRVFDKSFTGENGRLYPKATGLGLYLVKQLISKLGHGITITSKVQVGTTVTLIFAKPSFYEVVQTSENKE